MKYNNEFQIDLLNLLIQFIVVGSVVATEKVFGSVCAAEIFLFLAIGQIIFYWFLNKNDL